jgi:hypothetical protein
VQVLLLALGILTCFQLVMTNKSNVGILSTTRYVLLLEKHVDSQPGLEVFEFVFVAKSVFFVKGTLLWNMDLCRLSGLTMDT